MEILPYENKTHREKVIQLWKKVFGYQDKRNDPGLVIDKKLAVNDGLFFVGIEEGRIAGTVMAGYDGHRGWIYSLAVDPDEQKQGLGSALLDFAEQALAEIGCMKINLQILVSNGAVQEFYRKRGYSVEERISMGKQIDRNIPAT